MSKQRLLEGRSANAIKNRWYNHLKKSTATVSDPRRPLPYHVQQPLMNDQTTDHSLSEDDIKAQLSSLFTDNDIEASVPSLFTEDDIEVILKKKKKKFIFNLFYRKYKKKNTIKMSMKLIYFYII